MTSRPIRLGTRGSALARWQAGWVADRLNGALPGVSVEIVPISSRGDRHEGAISPAAGPGFFTSDLEDALAREEIDVAVHSLKDLPIEPGPGLEVAAIPVRHDPRDVLVARDGLSLAGLPRGARVGTSSPRRACLVRELRPDVEVAGIRGNVDTRVRAVVDERGYDAVVLAAAGVLRLGLEGRVTEWFDAHRFPPAPGQGALAVQVRADDRRVGELVARLDDGSARAAVTAERALLAGLGGGCSLPVGAHARVNGRALELVAFAGAPDGSRVLRVEERGEDPHAVGRAAAERLLDAGAAEVLA